MKSLGCAVVVAAVLAAPSHAQQTDFSQVQIKTTKIAGNFYTLEGQGGTIGVLAGPDGVFMVDAQFAPLSDKIIAAIKQISDGRIRLLVNTHVHPDHVGGNENIAKTGAVILARENLRARLAKPAPQANGQPGVPAPALALPIITYDAPLTIHMNGEDVQLVPVPVAHTDGDTMVYFPNANVIMTGDFYRSTGYPNIDRANGGTMNGMLAGFDAIVKLGRPDTKIVPGHGAIVDKAAVTAHKEMMMAVRDKVAALVRQNKTQDEVVAAKPTAEFDSKVTGATAATADRFVGQLYQEIKAHN
ncbi:MAG TPA: MBL fold metallo-hydrolase [Vicinamibacterales bacterium]|jgi:glyoxylase-like metal-dependent hydrolase (beta-lactamase superfamily II)